MVIPILFHPVVFDVSNTIIRNMSANIFVLFSIILSTDFSANSMIVDIENSVEWIVIGDCRFGQDEWNKHLWHDSIDVLRLDRPLCRLSLLNYILDLHFHRRKMLALNNLRQKIRCYIFVRQALYLLSLIHI